MNLRNDYCLQLFTFFLYLFFNADYVLSIEEFETREYPVPEHGNLVLTVPAEWNVTYYEPADISAPIIIFFPQQKPHAFQLTVSPLWDDGYFRDITDPDFIYDYVESVGVDLLEYSDQESVQLQKLNGQQGTGVYFQLSDESAPESEYKYITEGAIAVGELLVVFSYFSNKSNDQNTDVILNMLEQATQNHQRQVHFGKIN